MIQHIPNQPIRFPVQKLDDFDLCNSCVDEKPYRMKLHPQKDALVYQFRNPGLDISSQFQMNDFESKFTDEMNSGDNWSPSGSVEFGGGSANKSPGGAASLELTGWAPVSGRHYEIFVTVSGYGGGELVISHHTTDSNPITSNGTHSFSFYAFNTNNVLFSFDSDAEMSINQVYILELLPGYNALGWEVTRPVDLSFGSNFILKHTIGNTQSAVCNVMTPVPGTNYRLRFRVFGMTQGSLNVQMGGVSIPITSNGIYNYGFQTPLAGSPLSLIPDSGGFFDGSFQLISASEETTHHFAGLFDSSDNLIRDLTANILYEDGFATIYYPLAFGDDSGNSIPDGCYKICISDQSNASSPGGDLLFGAGEFSSQLAWEMIGGAKVENGFLVITEEGQGGQLAISISDFECFVLEFRIRIFENTDGVLESKLGISTRSIPIAWQSSGGSGHQEYVYRYLHTVKNPASIYFRWTGAGEIYIDHVRVFPGPFCGDTAGQECSEPFSMDSSSDCSKSITAKMDTVAGVKSAYGFRWFNYFLPNFRETIDLYAPVYPGEDEKYSYDDGAIKRPYGMSSKRFDLVFPRVDVHLHDAIRIMLKADELRIGDSPFNDFRQYACVSESYEPNWPRRVKTKLSDSKVEVVSKISNELYGHNVY
ncbi:MAG: hypothetical protein DWQ44_08940 [Bacteroidetes bacterium]|nr:MAG: hypothetical protein DWQ33_02835 [Bacteroidota bacterium]REK06415.1 MAG: hypothetical protein DWQ39_02730 [Bacteroidota bacterium]REK33181.1 MAG: hypothetical protein DWQ44_08940 [Bacteroidota bacterium]REK47017.1 MAG: hypothetical protein DWQ48_13270 [Bacteroidota bacterium]